MSNIGDIIVGILFVFIVLVGLLTAIDSKFSASLEIIGLDSACKEIMQDDTAIFVEDFGTQEEFKCRVGNNIHVIGGTE